MNQTPYARAARWHLEHCPETPFVHVVEAHFLHGYVWSTPEMFALARKVRHDWPESRLLDIRQTDPLGDCWFVWLFAGDPTHLPAADRLRLPWAAFHRDGRLVRLRWERAAEFLAGKWTARENRAHSRAHGQLTTETA